MCVCFFYAGSFSVADKLVALLLLSSLLWFNFCREFNDSSYFHLKIGSNSESSRAMQSRR